MKKRIYRATELTKVNIEQLAEKVKGTRVVFGVDIAKQDNYGALLICGDREPLITIKWRHPERSRQVVQVLKRLCAAKVEVAMEPSGTYGDPVRKLFWDEQIEVYRVSAKRSHDAVEVYDGVPSWHDAKSGAVIAKLHMDGASHLWAMEREYKRDLGAVVNTMDMVQQQYQQNTNRIEALMARHWPEVAGIITLNSVTCIELLKRFGSAQQVCLHAEEARQLIRKVAGSILGRGKVELIISTAKTTIGLPMTAVEAEEVMFLAHRTRQLQLELKSARKRITKQVQHNRPIASMSKVAGVVTAAVLVKGAGDPADYSSATQWVKSLGLNLKEKSSGKHKGRLKITKRGSGQARRWLYFLAMRLVYRDGVIKAWYRRKVARDGGLKMKALIAVMRKVAAGLWHVSQGSDFDSMKLFDVRRLGEV